MTEVTDYSKLKYTELYQVAKDRGLNPPAGMKKVDLVKLIKGEPLTVEGSDDEVKTGEVIAKKSDRVNITILESNEKNAVNPVPVGVNGVMYTITRGVPVDVPRGVVEALENARQIIYDAKNAEDGSLVMTPRTALSYPYTING